MTEKKESTHVLLDGEKLIISPNLLKIFHFLIDIDKEIGSILNFQTQLNNIRESYINTLDFSAYLAKKIEDNGIDISYELKEDLNKLGDKFEFYFPIRSQFIILFSYLEVIFCLYISFERETSNKDYIRNFVMNGENTRKFISDFILNKGNNYYLKNIKKLGGISPNSLRDLRNTLTHFYSVSSSIILLDDRNEDSNDKVIEKFKKSGKNNLHFLTSNDLYSLIGEGIKIFMKQISDLFISNPVLFERKINFTKSIVDESAAVLLNYK